jgi:hypothetical protein
MADTDLLYFCSACRTILFAIMCGHLPILRLMAMFGPASRF